MPLRKVNHMSEADHLLVSDAVSAAEQHTNGEIVTIVTDYSDHYRDVAILWAAVASFMALSALVLFPDFYLDKLEWITGGWGHEYSVSEYLGIILGIMTMKFLFVLLVMRWMPLR